MPVCEGLSGIRKREEGRGQEKAETEPSGVYLQGDEWREKSSCSLSDHSWAVPLCKPLLHTCGVSALCWRPEAPCDPDTFPDKLKARWVTPEAAPLQAVHTQTPTGSGSHAEVWKERCTPGGSCPAGERQSVQVLVVRECVPLQEVNP